jgi:hypothetical protein
MTTERNNSNNKDKRNKRPDGGDASTPLNLFEVLPFHEPTENGEDINLRPFACIPYVPTISYQLKRALGKAGCTTVFRSGTKLQSILCSKNKTRPDAMKNKGIYKFECPCDPKSIYIGEMARSFKIRTKEHQKAAEARKWNHSGLVQHKENCDAPIDWQKPTILATLNNKNKKILKFDLRLHEALEIRRHNSGPNRGLIEDWGSYAKTSVWTPVFNKMQALSNPTVHLEGGFFSSLILCFFLILLLFVPSAL